MIRKAPNELTEGRFIGFTENDLVGAKDSIYLKFCLIRPELLRIYHILEFVFALLLSVNVLVLY